MFCCLFYAAKFYLQCLFVPFVVSLVFVVPVSVCRGCRICSAFMNVGLIVVIVCSG